MLVYFGVTPDAKPRRQVFCVLVEYRLKKMLCFLNAYTIHAGIFCEIIQIISYNCLLNVIKLRNLSSPDVVFPVDSGRFGPMNHPFSPIPAT